jgi:acetyltransferase-like isoleucine patch superfamily enzyme
MGNIIIRIVKKIKTFFLKKNNVEYKLSFDDSVALGKEHNFHGNNKVKKCTIGINSYVSYNSIIYHTKIGKYCSIGPNVVIGYGDHPLDKISTSPNIYLNESLFTDTEIENFLEPHFKQVNIKNDVWIGANVYIKNGVTIGNGAVIASGSVVIKNVLDYEIVGGIPAKLIRRRFSQEIIQLLMQINWWDLEINSLKTYKKAVNNPSIENLEDMINKLNSK